jgi:hypothetical protein
MPHDPGTGLNDRELYGMNDVSYRALQWLAHEQMNMFRHDDVPCDNESVSPRGITKKNTPAGQSSCYPTSENPDVGHPVSMLDEDPGTWAIRPLFKIFWRSS